MLITIIILVLSAVFFVNGKIRSDLVALCALVALLIFQILTPDEALSGFSNSVVIMMVGLFVVGGAIFQTGLAKMISSHILKLAGKSELKLFLLVMLVTSAIGAFVSNTGTVALMLPIVVSLAVSANMNPSRLLMPHQEQHLMGCCSFCFAWILWSSKRADSNSPYPTLCVPRGRNAPVGRF